MTSSRVEDALYGEASFIRDEARADLIRSGSMTELNQVVEALSASLDLTRRRATRLLSDIQPHRARPAIIKWLERLVDQGWSHLSGGSNKSLNEGVAHAGRLLNQLTIRGESEPGLRLVFDSQIPKAQKVAICPASPPALLAHVINQKTASLLELALIESLRRLDGLNEEKEERRSALCSYLRKELPLSGFTQIKKVLDDDRVQLTLWIRLFVHLYAPSDTGSEYQNHELLSLSTLKTCDLLSLYPNPQILVQELFDTLSDPHHQESDLLQLLTALEKHQRTHGFIVVNELTTDTLNTLIYADCSEVRATIARLLPREHQGLDSLIKDQVSHVSWCAQESKNGRFSIQQIQARLGEHHRLELPSATPPYGLRDFDQIPKIKRIHAALALCQARFDVNVGVAMRSAEAAGFKEVFVVGVRSGALTSARGAEHAIPIRWLPDARSLISVARAEGYQLVAVQQTPDSEPYHQANYPPQPLFILGSEDAGLPDELRIGADLAVEIPLFGAIDSLNVATAATCVIMHWRAHQSATGLTVQEGI